MSVWLWALISSLVGALCGHLLRRVVPYALAMRNPRPPFETPWMEGLTAALFALWALRPPSFPGIALVLSLFLVAVVATDYFAKLIPDRLTFSGAAVGCLVGVVAPGAVLERSWWHEELVRMVGLEAGSPASGLFLAMSGALLGFLILEGIRGVFGLAVGMQVMGMGDSKLLLMIGAFLGPVGAATTLVVAFLVGVVHGLVYLRLTGHSHSPFGPPLAAAAVLVVGFADVLASGIGAFQLWVLALPLTVLAAVYTVLIVVAVLLLWKTRRRAAEYEEAIEEDYREIESRLDAE